MLTFPKPCSWIKNRNKGDARSIQNDFALIWKINGDFAANVGLDLPGAPVWLGGVTNEHTGCKDRV